MADGLDVQWLGRVDYAEALELQARQVAARRAGECGDTLLLLEHPPVITLGRSAHEAHLLRGREELLAAGVAVHEVNRGGDVTYHAPGQLVGYLVTDLAAKAAVDVHAFLREIETALIDALAMLSLRARRIEGMTGVYMDLEGEPARPRKRDRKIASIGVGVRGWVSFHGFALNVSLDLLGFRSIVPCGLQQVEMTSVLRELADPPEELDARVRACVIESFQKRFG